MPKKKISKKKPIKKKKTKTSSAKAKKSSAKKSAVKPIGTVTHFFGNIKVAIIKFKKPVKVSSTIRIKGATTDFSQVIASMQLNHAAIKAAKPGKEIGIKVKGKVREGDLVYPEKN